MEVQTEVLTEAQIGVEAEAQEATWCRDWLPRHEPRHGQAPQAVEKKAHFGGNEGEVGGVEMN